MAIDDALWKAYLVGTKEEIESYRAKAESKDWVKGGSLLIGEGATGIAIADFIVPVSYGGITVAGLPFSIDLFCRFAHWCHEIYKERPEELPLVWHQPGLVGTVRELYAKRKTNCEQPSV